jgi:chemotaxis protein methyltransferase CheR
VVSFSGGNEKGVIKNMGDYEVFKKKILQLTKIDLNCYKERQMKRRIDALIGKAKITSYDEYLEAIQKDSKMMEDFVAYLTINVSEFYRNPDQWKVLENDILPYLFERFGNDIKIWSAACSTGDEPYTLVMLLAKFIPMNKIKIIATDIDKQVLEKAQMGIYDEKSLKGLPREYVAKYFTKVGGRSYQVVDEVKRCVEFKQHNLLKDPYPERCDMIVCRNVMIYFTEEAKGEIYHKFNSSLKDGGMLFVGSTEQIISPGGYNFSTYKSFFYKKD